jgi:hypothetical protein
VGARAALDPLHHIDHDGPGGMTLTRLLRALVLLLASDRRPARNEQRARPSKRPRGYLVDLIAAVKKASADVEASWRSPKAYEP